MTFRFLSPYPAMVIALFCGTAVPAAAQEAACAPVDAVETAPPPLPTYDQPPVPGPGYLWSPGNWSWDEERADYYWCQAPGSSRRDLVCYGPLASGARLRVASFSIPAIGVTGSASMAASITALAMAAWATRADAGIMASSSTIAP
jgi:hypothetical protein